MERWIASSNVCLQNHADDHYCGMIWLMCSRLPLELATNCNEAHVHMFKVPGMWCLKYSAGRLSIPRRRLELLFMAADSRPQALIRSPPRKEKPAGAPADPFDLRCGDPKPSHATMILANHAYYTYECQGGWPLHEERRQRCRADPSISISELLPERCVDPGRETHLYRSTSSNKN